MAISYSHFIIKTIIAIAISVFTESGYEHLHEEASLSGAELVDSDLNHEEMSASINKRRRSRGNNWLYV